MNKRVKEKGITLIALIVTIVILLILAGISIGTLTGDNGIIKQAQTAKTETERSDIEEKINVIVIDNSKERDINKDKLINDFENKLPDGKEIVDSDNLIYIIYPEYSFEVDIDSGEVKETEIEKVEDDTPWELAGNGTEEDPYLIESIEDLVAFSNSVNNGNTYSSKYVKLTTDLDFNLPFSYDNPKTKVSEKTNRIIEEDSNGTELKEFLISGTGFNPIGNESKAFRGNFDGNGKEIKNIYINRPEEDYVALFGKFENNYATIEKIGITGSIIGNEYVGGIVGSSGYNSKVNFCYNTAVIIGDKYVGGIEGEGSSNFINNYNLGNIKGNEYIGGICGYKKGDSKYCYNSGNISSVLDTGNEIGGIYGYNQNESNYCYNIGNIDVTKGSNIGGIVGYHCASGAVLNNSYNAGRVNVKEKIKVGGIAGSVNTGKINRCFYLKNTAEGGITGNDIEGQAMPLEESKMPSVISVLMTDNDKVEWNGEMVDVWKEDTNNINNGYPILFWQ